MRRIDVPLAGRSCPVLIGHGLLDRAGDLLVPHVGGGRLVAVSDETVWAAQGSRLSGLALEPLLVPPGEGSKCWPVLARLCDRLLELGVGRGDTILAFGGGMVGDLAGFAAAILNRGCAWVQVPTSLLAQVDSSVGGKTAINTSAGKNMIGAFHQPSAVLIDPSTLGTLPGRELRAGYAEIVKYGLLGDPAFFDWCEAQGEALLAGDGEARLRAIETCVGMKAAIVAEDERETKGRRALLNLGHTFGHAVEAETDLRHGEAVAIGLVLAFRFSAERGLCSAEEAERIRSHLAKVGLPTSLPDVDPARLIARIAADKKASGGRPAFVLVRGIGRAFLDRSVELSEVEAFLRARR